MYVKYILYIVYCVLSILRPIDDEACSLGWQTHRQGGRQLHGTGFSGDPPSSISLLYLPLYTSRSILILYTLIL